MQDELIESTNTIMMDAADTAIDVAPAVESASKAKPKKVSAPKPTWTPGEIVSVLTKHCIIAEDKNDPLFDVRGLEPADQYLVEDIKKDGFNSTPWGVEREAGTLTIFAGRRRFNAAVEAGKGAIDVKIFDSKLDAFDLIRLMISENARRLEDNSMNKARKAKRLLNAFIERHRPASEGVKQGDDGNIEYTGDAWTPPAKMVREGMEEVAKAFGFKSSKRVKDQLLPLVENLSLKVQKALESGKIAEAVALQWKDKTHEQQERALEKALEKAAGAKVQGGGATRNKDGSYPKLQFKRPQLEELYEAESAPKQVQEFLGFYLGHNDLEQAPKWIQKLMAIEEEEEGEE